MSDSAEQQEQCRVRWRVLRQMAEDEGFGGGSGATTGGAAGAASDQAEQQEQDEVSPANLARAAVVAAEFERLQELDRPVANVAYGGDLALMRTTPPVINYFATTWQPVFPLAQGSGKGVTVAWTALSRVVLAESGDIATSEQVSAAAAAAAAAVSRLNTSSGSGGGGK